MIFLPCYRNLSGQSLGRLASWLGEKCQLATNLWRWFVRKSEGSEVSRDQGVGVSEVMKCYEALVEYGPILLQLGSIF